MRVSGDELIVIVAFLYYLEVVNSGSSYFTTKHCFCGFCSEFAFFFMVVVLESKDLVHFNTPLFF